VSSVTSHVTRLRLTKTDQASRQDITAIVGRDFWQVEWTLRTNGRDQEFGMSHATRKAAHRHVQGLLTRLAPGVVAADIYTEQLD
jgi:hypothetical protein